MEHISPDTILLPRALSTFTYSRLIALLSEGGTWRTVAETLGIFSKNYIERISRTNTPAEVLVIELGARLCPVGFFCDILKKCNLYNILMLFRHDGVEIIEETSGNVRAKMIGVGGQLRLICRATSVSPPHYQWYCNNEKLPAQEDPVLCIDDFGMENEGEYFCTIRQDGQDYEMASNSINVSLTFEGPTLLVQPAASTFCKIGTTIVLSLRAKGHPKLTYQWYKGGKGISGSNEPSLVLNVSDESFGGSYRCYIWNALGGMWSDESEVKVFTSSRPEPSAKVALLIANESYDNLRCLETPANDVRTLAEILEGLGFHTVALQNLNLTEMRSIIYYIADVLPKNAYVVFYFSGHGFEICDKFMLPVNVPGPEDFLQTHALSERELLRAILNSQPMLFLEFLDMCLKPPNPSNKKIFNEKINLYEYSASHNLIQAYATTSNSSAYEKRTDENGLYVKHLKEYFLKKNDMPIVEILQNVAKDIAKVCPIQKPFFGTNVTVDYRLTDRCSDNTKIGEKIKALLPFPRNFILPFKQLSVNSTVSLTPFQGVFFNTVELRFSNLQDFKVHCEVPGDELTLELSRMNGDALLKIINIQKLISDKILSVRLYQKNGLYLDKAQWVIKKPLLAAINLRDEVRSSTRVGSEGAEEQRKSNERSRVNSRVKS